MTYVGMDSGSKIYMMLSDAITNMNGRALGIRKVNSAELKKRSIWEFGYNYSCCHEYVAFEQVNVSLKTQAVSKPLRNRLSISHRHRNVMLTETIIADFVGAYDVTLTRMVRRIDQCERIPY
jgi:hypothetical protein